MAVPTLMATTQSTKAVMAVSTLMVTQASLIVCIPLIAHHATTLQARIRRPPPLPNLSFHSFSPLPKPSKLRITASSISPARRNPVIKSPAITDPYPDSLSGPTRTATTAVAVALAATRFFADGLFSLAMEMKEPLLHTAGPAFFAAVARERLDGPFTAVAAGMAKWIDLYHAILTVRVLLTWFPNVEWDRQPFSALRDLCDPYLNLFRNIIPPVFDRLDISSIFAFAVLEFLATILKPVRFG